MSIKLLQTNKTKWLFFLCDTECRVPKKKRIVFVFLLVLVIHFHFITLLDVISLNCCHIYIDQYNLSVLFTKLYTSDLIAFSCCSWVVLFSKLKHGLVRVLSTCVRSKCYLNCNCNFLWPFCGWLLLLSACQTLCFVDLCLNVTV